MRFITFMNKVKKIKNTNLKKLIYKQLFINTVI